MSQTANDAFIAAELEFDRLMTALAELRAGNFRVKGDRRHWGDVGSVHYVNAQLREALAHYGPRGALPTFPLTRPDGRTIRVSIPEDDT